MHGKRMKNGEKWEIIRNRGRGWKKFRFLHLWIWVCRGGLRERMRWDWIRWDILWMYNDFFVLFCESIVDNIGLLSIMIDFWGYFTLIIYILYDIILFLVYFLYYDNHEREKKEKAFFWDGNSRDYSLQWLFFISY